jgi:hypothetical protein
VGALDCSCFTARHFFMSSSICFFILGRSRVGNMGGDIPGIALGIDKSSTAVAPAKSKKPAGGFTFCTEVIGCRPTRSG